MVTIINKSTTNTVGLHNGLKLTDGSFGFLS